MPWAEQKVVGIYQYFLSRNWITLIGTARDMNRNERKRYEKK
jgi:uncharacterized DUF497 family protein